MERECEEREGGREREEGRFGEQDGEREGKIVRVHTREREMVVKINILIIISLQSYKY